MCCKPMNKCGCNKKKEEKICGCFVFEKKEEKEKCNPFCNVGTTCLGDRDDFAYRGYGEEGSCFSNRSFRCR